MTGKKIGNLPTGITPPEWFDLDRSEKTMAPDDNCDDFVEVSGGPDEPGVKCPSCESTFIEYEGEQYDDEYHEGSAYKCHDCGLHFVDGDRFMMD